MHHSDQTTDNTVDNTLSADERAETETASVEAHAELHRALQRRPRTVPPRWLYDDRGSDLFDQITRLPEYYQTEAERQILADHSKMIAEMTAATTVIELG